MGSSTQFALTWFSILSVTVTLAVMLLAALPSGMPLQILGHAVLLVAGAATMLALHRSDG